MTIPGSDPPIDSPFGSPLAAEPIVAAELAPAAIVPTRPRVWTVVVTLVVVIAAIIVLQIVAVVPIVVWHLQQGTKPDELQAKLIETLSHPAAFLGLAARPARDGRDLRSPPRGSRRCRWPSDWALSALDGAWARRSSFCLAESCPWASALPRLMPWRRWFRRTKASKSFTTA